MKKMILNLWQENGTLFMTIQKPIMRKEITYNKKALKSNLCDYNQAYILLGGVITVTAAPQIQVTFKNCALFTRCITKIDGTTADDVEYLDFVMPMYNLI